MSSIRVDYCLVLEWVEGSVYLKSQAVQFRWYAPSSPAASHMTSDEEQAFMLKDYAHQIIILIIALRQGRYFTT